MTIGLRIALVLAALAPATPAHSQYVFLDVDGDGQCSQVDGGLPVDRLGPSVTTVRVYFVTDKNRDKSAAVCSNSADPFSIFSYSIAFHASGPGTVTYGAWADYLGFSYGLTTCGDGTVCSEGNDVWIARGSRWPLSPGKYLVGALSVTVTGAPVLEVVSRSRSIPAAETSFGSACLGENFNNTVRFGEDFTDSDGTEASTPATMTVWEKVKSLYR